MAEEETFGEAAQKAREDIVKKQAELDLEKEILKVRQQKNELYKSDIGLAEQEAEIKDKELQYQKQMQAFAEARKEGQEQDIEAEAAILAKLRQKTEEKKKQLELDKAASDMADNTFKRLTSLFYEEKPETGIASIITNPGKFLGRFGDNVKKMMANPLGIASGVISTVTQQSIQLALAQDAAAVSFARNTGQGVEFTDNIVSLERSLFQAGVTSDEAGRAVQSLFMNVTDFTEMSEKQQQVLGENVALLQELGVSSETAAKNIQFATKVLGMSVNQSARLQRELLTFAQDLGVSVDQIASDFASMGPQIAALGTDGVDAFRRLEVQSKNTGLALNEIVGIVEKFDKFDTAAQSVGRLNALLGGPYLNTLELVAETDPSKRFEILKNRVDAAGLSFDTMDYYQKKALASAMGLNEQQLALMMRGRLDLIQEPQKSAADIEALAAQTAQFNTMMEELGQIAMSFAVSFSPVVTFFKNVLQFFGDLTPILIGIGLVFAPITGTIGTITGAILLLTQAWRGLTHGLQFGFSMTPAAALGMTAEAIDGVTASMDNMPISKTVDVMSNIAHSMDPAKASAVVKTASVPIDTTSRPAAALTSAAARTVEREVPAEAPPAPQPQAVQGPPPVINITLQVDGTEFAAVVNDVSVEKYSGGKPSEMYASIISMIEQGFVRGV
jgi:hypothetical protein